MIARTWHGVVPNEQGDTYYDYLIKTGINDFKQVKGNLGVEVLRRDEKQETHFLHISFWDSNESIKEFAGDDYTIACYYPEDKKFLKDFEPVYHYEVMKRD